MIDEELLLSGVNHKNEKAWKSLYDYFYAALCAYTQRILQNHGAAEDLVQEVFMSIWNTDRQFESVQDLTRYLYRSCYNNALLSLRNHHLHDSILNRIGHEESGMTEDDLYELTVRQEVTRQLYVHINNLPEEQKKVLLLVIEGYSREEIAEQLGVSVNTIKTHKSRGFKTLRSKLKMCVCLYLLP